MKFQELIKYEKENLSNSEKIIGMRGKLTNFWCEKCNKEIEYHGEDYCLVPVYEPGFASAKHYRSDGLIMTFACHNEQISFHFNTERELVSVLMKERED